MNYKPPIVNNIPLELQQLNQWVVWRYEQKGENEKLTKPPYCARTGELADVGNPLTWSSFAVALDALRSGKWAGIGFVTHINDPYAFIDLDTVHDPIKQQKQIDISNRFDSYSERSPGGGLHIIVKGALPDAIKKDWIELYSKSRYMTVTGDVHNLAPIRMQTTLLNALYESLAEPVNTYAAAEDNEQQFSDAEILQQANSAKNGVKFAATYNGNFEHFYPSASEADFGLVDMLVFYTQNYAQVRRLFEASALGQRGKYQQRRDKTKYFDRMYNRAFDRNVPLVNVDKLRSDIDAAIAFNQTNNVTTKNVFYEQPQEKPQQFVPTEAPTNVDGGCIVKPTGLTGQLAQFIYDKSYKPIPETAIVGAIAIMAGVCGRSFNTYTGLGLNLYLLLLADTAVGKNGPKQATNALFEAAEAHAPTVKQHRGPDAFASGQSLVKRIGQNNVSLVSIFDEFGKLWKRLTRDRAASSDTAMVEMLLTLYSSSGKDDLFNGRVYADEKQNVPELKSPSFSFFGLSTASTFLSTITPDTIESGFLPRLTIINYKGGRPRSNDFAAACQPSQQLLQNFATLVNTIDQYNRADQTYCVPINDDAKQLSREYEAKNDDAINNTKDGYLRQLLSRLHASALKIASLIAIGNDLYNPRVTVADLQYAINFVELGVNQVAPDIAETVTENLSELQLAKLLEATFDFYNATTNRFASYGVTDAMFNAKIIPLRYYQKKLGSKKCYTRDYRKTPDVVNATLQMAIDDGSIALFPPLQAQKQFNTTSKLFICSDATVVKGRQ